MVGSIAYDSVESPEGKIEDALGGSAIYGGIASQFHAKRLNLGSVGLVGVVGNDFLDDDRKSLEDLGLDLRGIETADGSTFRWSGSYHGDMGVAQTHDTQLNVFGEFEPKVPDFATKPSVLFCANLLPILQSKVLDQVQHSRLSMLDSMNLWITTALDDLLSVMKRVDLIIINDGEVKMIANDDNFIRASRNPNISQNRDSIQEKFPRLRSKNSSLNTRLQPKKRTNNNELGGVFRNIMVPAANRVANSVKEATSNLSNRLLSAKDNEETSTSAEELRLRSSVAHEKEVESLYRNLAISNGGSLPDEKVKEMKEIALRRKAISEQVEQDKVEVLDDFSFGDLIDSDTNKSNTGGKEGLPRIDS